MRRQFEEQVVGQLSDHADFRRLQTIPGIGPILALIILAEAGDLRRFNHYQKFLKYCGLNLSTKQSGKFRGTTRLSMRGTYWHYDFWFEGIRYRSSTKQRGKREAEKVVNAIKTDLARRKVNLPSKSLRFREVCGRYSEFAKTNHKPAYATEKYHLSKHLVPYFGEILVHAINMIVCESYKRKRRKAGAKEFTINREFSTLKAVLRFAAESNFAPEGLGKGAKNV